MKTYTIVTRIPGFLGFSRWRGQDLTSDPEVQKAQALAYGKTTPILREQIRKFLHDLYAKAAFASQCGVDSFEFYTWNEWKKFYKPAQPKKPKSKGGKNEGR